MEIISGNVVYLHGLPPPVAQFLRIGSTGHRRLEQFLAAGQLPIGPPAKLPSCASQMTP
jgi:hypothetical protein